MIHHAASSGQPLGLKAPDCYDRPMDADPERLARDYESLYKSYIALKREVEHLSTLREIALSLNGSLDLDETLTIIGTVVHGALEVQRLTLFQIDEESNQATPIMAKYGGDVIGKSRLAEDGIRLAGTPIEAAKKTRRNIYDTDDLRQALYMPLLTDKEVVGVMELARTLDDTPFSKLDDPLYTSIGGQIGAAVNNAQLYALAVTDGLTGLYVRRYFDLRLNEEFNMARRYDRVFTLLIFDIDHFKKFNDTHGHQTGDTVLQQFAQCIEDNTRNTDICCRYGGEEFTVILPETDLDVAMVLAEKLRNHVEERVFIGSGGESLHVTTSIGVAECGPDIDEPGALVKVADDALYQAKEDGRNCVRQAS